MNYYILLFPTVSLFLFYLIFTFPQAALVSLFLSPVFLVRYLGAIDRTKQTDIAFLAIIGIATVFLPIQSLSYFLMILAPIVFLTIFREKYTQHSYIPTVFAPLPLAVTLAVLVILVPAWREAITAQMVATIDMVLNPFNDISIDAANYNSVVYLRENKADIANSLTNISPAIMFTLISIMVFIADKFSNILAANDETKFRDFRLPDNFIIPFIVGGFLILIDNDITKAIAYNIIIVYALLYFYQGLQLLFIMFDNFNLSRLIRLILYIFIFAEPILLMMIAIIGLFSIWYTPKWFKRAES